MIDLVIVDGKRVSEYAKASCERFKCNFNDVVTKFSNILSDKDLHNLFEDIDKEKLSIIYNKLSSLPVIIIGSRSGYAPNVYSIDCENKYELINIIAIIYDGKNDTIPELINILDCAQCSSNYPT